MWNMLQMHFVKKVPTTEEEKLAKEKEQNVKLRMFLKARDDIFHKRAYKEYDDGLLAMTEKLLSKNPDIYTFWNIRRETFEEFRLDNEAGSAVQHDMEKLYENELALTEEAIRANPKSYSAWFQRGWILKRQAQPNLEKELALCEAALKLDCRNFHCWDHRRIVVQLANHTAEDELAFSQRLVAENFSNFSAWHVRMNLLPREKDKESGELILPQKVAHEELQRVANAIFTDPDDQSAWMFARWLIHIHSSTSFLNEESACPVAVLAATLSPSAGGLLISFTRAVNEVEASAFTAHLPRSATAHSLSSVASVVSRVWQFTWDSTESASGIQVSLDGEAFMAAKEDDPVVNRPLITRIFVGAPCPLISTLYNHAQQLLMEEENNNAFAVLTLTQCLRATSPLESHDEIVSNLERLARDLDPLRANMYKTWVEEEKVRRALLTKERTEDSESRLERLLGGQGELSLNYLHLTHVPYVQVLCPLVTSLSLRGNRLTTLTHLSPLVRLHTLCVDENPFERLSPGLSSLQSLEFLSIGGCSSVKEVSAVLPLLSTLTSLKRFLYCETPLVDKTEELRPQLSKIRLIPYYL